MLILRSFVCVVSLGLALFCAEGAYLISYVNSRPAHWLAGPLQFWGITMSPGTAIAALVVLAISFVCLATHVLFAPSSNN
jgi:ABC-type branched-subunit amino acid transport system permease subunit